MQDDMMNRSPDKHEAAMARADLYKLANYSMKLFKMIHEGQELEGWVQAKITKAADYVSSVYHFMAYEMKATDYGSKLENSDVYSESVRRAFEQKLLEAKRQAEKIKESGEHDTLARKGDANKTHNPTWLAADEEWMKKHPKLNKERTKDLKSQIKGRMDRGDYKKKDTVDEGWDDMLKAAKERSGPQPSGGSGIKKGSRYGGSKQVDAPEKDEEDEKPKKNKKVKEAAKPDYLDFDKDGNKKEPMKKALKDKKVKETAMMNPKGKPSSIPSTATTTVPGMKATPMDLKKSNSSAALGEGKCNHTPKGKKCPVHGLKECGSMYEAKNLKQQAAIAIAKKKAK